MAFEAKNLRVQLPCRQVTLLDCGLGDTVVQARCPNFNTCYVWHSYVCGGFWSQCTGTDIVCQFGSRVCGGGTLVAEITPEVLCAGSEPLQRRFLVEVG